MYQCKNHIKLVNMELVKENPKVEALIQAMNSQKEKKEKSKKTILIKETYDDYLNYVGKINPKNYRWVYDILEGKTEQGDILYQDKKILLIPSDIWLNKNDMTKFHYLVFSKDQCIKTLRTLNGSHIQLLEYMMNKSLEILENKYHMYKNDLLIYIHYPPSTYYFHIHFSVPSAGNTSFEYSHDLHQVIYNLKMKPNYYQEIELYRPKSIYRN